MNTDAPRSTLYPALLLKGFVAITIQTLIIRELLIVFSGNELTIAIILGTWIFLEAMGSGLLGKIQTERAPLSYCTGQLTLACLLLPTILFIRNAKNILGVLPSETLGLGSVFIIALAALAPFCLIDGFLFTAGSRSLAHGDPSAKHIGRTYILEALGVLIGAPLFTFAIAPWFSSVTVAMAISLLQCISSAAIIFSLRLRRRSTLIFSALSGILACLCLFLLTTAAGESLQRRSLQNQFHDFNILRYKNSIYTNICVASRQGQQTFFLGGTPVFTLPYAGSEEAQELVHFPLLIHPDPRRILVIGNPIGILDEIAKHRFESVTYAEPDAELVTMLRATADPALTKLLSDTRIKIVPLDGRTFIKATADAFDVILVNLPEPSAIQINRFYTKEFFVEARRILGASGILSFLLPGTTSYYPEELSTLNTCILTTIKEAFPQTEVIPGERNIIIASASKFSLDPKRLSAQAAIRLATPTLLTPDYISLRLDANLRHWFYDATRSVTAGVNKDSRPLAVFYTLAWWNARFYPRLTRLWTLVEQLPVTLVIVAAILLTLFCILQRRERKNATLKYTIATTGFSGIALSVILILCFQSRFGFIYSRIALLSGFFMAGVGAGGIVSLANLGRWSKDGKTLIAMEVFLGVIAIITAAALSLPQMLNTRELYLLALLAGTGTGLEFPLCNQLYLKNNTRANAGSMYAVDLLGSCTGALVCGVILIPLYGMRTTALLIVLAKTASIILLSSAKLDDPSSKNR